MSHPACPPGPPRPPGPSGPPRPLGPVAVIAFDGISPFHLSVPCLVFGEDRSDLGVPPIELTVCAAEPGRLRSAAGFGIETRHGLGALRRAGTIVVPSWRDPAERAPEALLAALRQAHRRGARIVGLCLGAYVLAQAGLLDGRRATTHWHFAADFRARHPAVHLDPDVLYIDDGDLLTSAGTVAGIDCCLHLLRGEIGAELANRVARRLVVAPHREGGQAQFIEQALPPPPVRSGAIDRLATVIDWAASHLDQAHTLDTLAERAAMSRRSFTRHFRRRTGATVLQWLLAQRLAQAQRLLETGALPVDGVAEAAGFGSAVALRQHFAAAFGTTPTAWRRRFRADAGAAAPPASR